MSAKMQDVARHAGVSTATVSRVLNNPDLVSQATRERVMAAMRDLDYRLNLAARSLRTNQTHTIAVVIPTIAEPVINEVIEAVEDVAIKENYTLLLCSTRGDPRREKTYSQLIMQQAMVDGVLYISPRASPDQVRTLAQGSAPLVLCNYALDDPTIPAIQIDHASSIRQCTSYLLSLGHRRIALLNLAARYYQPARMRHMGFEQAFLEYGLSPDPALMIEIDQLIYANNRWHAAIDRLLSLPEPPTAIVAFNDTVALLVYAACRQRGLRIPDDLSVTGCDDISSAQYVEPPLTTVRVPAYEQGERAMNTLLSLLRGEPLPVAPLITLDVELIIRESCAPPRS